MSSRNYDLNISRTTKEGLREFYQEVTESWKTWRDKPKDDSEFRLGYLGEPTGHPEYIDLLKEIKPSEIMTDGRIIGTPGDPRRMEILRSTLDSGAKIILRYSDTSYYRKSLGELLNAKANLIIGIPGNICVKEFREKIKFPDRKYIVIPEVDINDAPITPEGLKNEEDLLILEYRENILLMNKKVIITKNILNLRPIKIYD